MTELILRIDGMHCGSCVRRVSQALAGTEGVVVKEVSIGAARVTSPPEGADQKSNIVEQAIAALAKAGYSAYLEQ